ncbi:U6 snRNA phosphodiesterase-like [Huso huso]|uniref:U6 snRNA phosphodiesterase 1 n=1 Tax=Huso huso TaxID=61971 RepID=A0ABR0YXU7_HUSHU
MEFGSLLLQIPNQAVLLRSVVSSQNDEYRCLTDLAEDESLELVDQLISGAGTHGVSLTRMEEFHITLSQTVILRHHWIEPFVESFHISLAWCVGDCSESLQGCFQELQNIVDDFEDSASLLRFSGHEIRCKSRN